MNEDLKAERIEPLLFRTGGWHTYPALWGLVLLGLTASVSLGTTRPGWLRWHPIVLTLWGLGLGLVALEVGLFLRRRRAHRRLLHRLMLDPRYHDGVEVRVETGLAIERGGLGDGGIFLYALGRTHASEFEDPEDAGRTVLAILRLRDGREIDLCESRFEWVTLRVARQAAKVLGLPCVDRRRGRLDLEPEGVSLPRGIRAAGRGLEQP
jgi:hypothetical protein